MQNNNSGQYNSVGITENRGCLQGIRVLEWAEMISGPYCSKLLADLGAEVIKIEKPVIGDGARHAPPFADNIQDIERSLLFLNLNTNKMSVELDIQRKYDLDKFLELIKWVDILIEDNPYSTLKSLRLTYDELSLINPNLIMTSVTPFGRSGPYRDYKAYPLNVCQSAGLGYISPEAFEGLDQRPLKPGANFSEYACGLIAAVGTFAALYAQKKSGRGQHIDVSKQEAILSLFRVHISRFPNEGTIQSRYFRRKGIIDVFSCKDGCVLVMVNQPHEWQALVQLMQNHVWERDDRYSNHGFRAQHWDEICEQISKWMSNNKVEDIYHAGQKLRCPITPIMTARDIAISPQSAARGFFMDVSHAIAGDLKYPTVPYHFSMKPVKIERAAPLLGQHNTEVLTKMLNSNTPFNRSGTFPKSVNSARRQSDEYGPLHGIRVADFSWLWAGSYATELLAFLGAEVIKIESMRRLDLTRLFSFTTGQVSESVDESHAFNDLNLGKLSLRLNLSKPKAIELAKKLVSTSDVVMENMRPGVMERLGLGYDELKKTRSDIIYLSSSARGADGPESRYSGYAPSFSAWGGLSYITGNADGKPSLHMGEIDLLSGATSAYAILAALNCRLNTGEGQYIDLSSSESISVLLGEVLLDYIANGRIQTRKGNSDELMVPHNCYRCRGDDKWISIAIATEEEWQSFCSVIDNPSWIMDKRFATAEGRRRRREELDRLIDGWTINHGNYELMVMFQKAGVAAMPCSSAEELFNDSHINNRQCWVNVVHPVTGERSAIAPPWKLSATPARIESPAPTFGQHSKYILKGLLGLSETEIVQLEEEQVVY